MMNDRRRIASLLTLVALAAAPFATVVVADEDEGRAVRVKVGPYGPYIEMDPEKEDAKPKRVSLPDGMDPADVDLAYAVKLLELPRTVGEDPSTGEEIVAGIGRYGPFVRRGKIFASLPNHDALWDVTVEKASELIEAKKSGRRVPLKELGKHPDSGKELTVHSGRYGPYVTDGDVNATLPKGTEPEEVDLETAARLVDEKAAKGGGKKGRKGGRKPARKGGRTKKKS